MTVADRQPEAPEANLKADPGRVSAEQHWNDPTNAVTRSAGLLYVMYFSDRKRIFDLVVRALLLARRHFQSLALCLTDQAVRLQIVSSKLLCQ